MRGRLDPAVHQPGLGEFELVLEPQAAPAVEQPERAAGRGRRGHRPVQELDVELAGLDVRFRQIGDLGHQLADLVLRLLEQTSIDGFFRHGGTSSLRAEAVVPAPNRPMFHSATTATRSGRLEEDSSWQTHSDRRAAQADIDNGTTHVPHIPGDVKNSPDRIAASRLDPSQVSSASRNAR